MPAVSMQHTREVNKPAALRVQHIVNNGQHIQTPCWEHCSLYAACRKMWATKLVITASFH